VKDSKKGFLKYVNSRRRISDNIGPSLDECDHLTNRDIDKAETFNAMFVFNTNEKASDICSLTLFCCYYHPFFIHSETG